MALEKNLQMSVKFVLAHSYDENDRKILISEP